MMKFDVVVGNPPYSDNVGRHNAKSLYTDFYKQSIRIGNMSALVLPYAPNRKPSYHYKMMDEHVVDVSEDIGKSFAEQRIRSNIRIFISTSKKQAARHPALVPCTDFYPLPSRRRLKPLYGPNAILRGGYVDHEGDTLPCVYSLTVRGPKWKQIRRSLINQWTTYPVAQTDWVVLLDRGISRPRKIKAMKCRNPGYLFMSDKVALFECEDEADADDMIDWFRSSEFEGMVEEGITKLGSRRGDYIGSHIMSLLPSHRGTEA